MTKQCRSCALLKNEYFACGMFRLDFAWAGPPPKAGQFFMVKPKRTSVFLPRPISFALWEPALKEIRFLVTRRGRGIDELLAMNTGEEAEITGPLGNRWIDNKGMENRGKIALVGGGVGIAPLLAFANEWEDFDLYAGFRTSPREKNERRAVFGLGMLGAGRFVLATEDGGMGNKGRITDFLQPADYAAVFACGPLPLLKAAAALCGQAGTPCFVSMERRMACGVGACLGCTVRIIHGNKRCCADGPVFPAHEVIFYE
jgi:NAD(P)H-flavin reductase